MNIAGLAICLVFVSSAASASAPPVPSAAISSLSAGQVALASDPEMAALFAADQADRKRAGQMNWSEVSVRDRSRRARVRKLLDQGRLRTGDDFFGAAFVFQHGEESNDFLLAHTLAVAAIAQGRSDASWIAAATLDRFLQKLDRPQIFGTQFITMPGEPASQGAYDRKLISDKLREVLRVPALEKQAQRLKRIEAKR